MEQLERGVEELLLSAFEGEPGSRELRLAPQERAAIAGVCPNAQVVSLGWTDGDKEWYQVTLGAGTRHL